MTALDEAVLLTWSEAARNLKAAATELDRAHDAVRDVAVEVADAALAGLVTRQMVAKYQDRKVREAFARKAYKAAVADRRAVMEARRERLGVAS